LTELVFGIENLFRKFLKKFYKNCTNSFPVMLIVETPGLRKRIFSCYISM